MRRIRPLAVAALLTSLGVTAPASGQVAVETYSGDKTYTFTLPGAPSSAGLLFPEDITVNSLAFTPGSVTFRGQPVDFSGTEASFLAGTYNGSAQVPVAAGPATVDVASDFTAVGAVNAPFVYDRKGIDLGPGFGANNLDIVPGPHPKPTVFPVWSSPAVPELNDLPVEQDIAETITAVDAVFGIVDANFTATITVPNLKSVETYTGDGIYTFTLPGVVVGPDRIIPEDLTVTNISFTPGSVTFAGMPVDFSGTEASWLASTYTGDATFPFVGPATVDVDGSLNAAGALNGPIDTRRRDLVLGNFFNPVNFDLPLQSYAKDAFVPSWNSPVVPELNGIEVLQSIHETITAVDALNGIVDVTFLGTVLVDEPIPTPAIRAWGLALVCAGLVGMAAVLLAQRRTSGAAA